MPIVDSYYRNRRKSMESIGKILKCGNKKVFLIDIKLRDMYIGDHRDNKIYATCLPLDKIHSAMRESISKGNRDTNQIITKFESALGDKIIRFTKEDLRYSY